MSKLKKMFHATLGVISLVEAIVLLSIISLVVILANKPKVFSYNAKDQCFKDGGSEYSVRLGCVYKKELK